MSSWFMKRPRNESRTRPGSLRRRGVTLVETVTASAIFVVMLGGFVAVSSGAGREWRTGTAMLTADNNASLALQTISRDVRNGISGSVTNSSLYVVMPYINAQGDYERYTNGPTVRYYVDTANKRLMRQESGSAATTLAKNVTSATFSVSGTQVSIVVTCTQLVAGVTKSTTLTSEASLRNDATE